MSSARKITILCGTQTGNAEDVSGRIGRIITRMQCKSQIFICDDFFAPHLAELDVVIFVCSTTGNGEFPDNMKSFWKFLLRKGLPSNFLSRVHFCVFGLGDSSYDKFNVVAKKLNKRLLQLGATQLIPVTLADDQHELGYDAALDPWLNTLKLLIHDYYKLSDAYLSEDVPLPTKYTIKFSTDDILENKITNCVTDQKSNFPLATVKTNQRVTSNDHFQAVHLLEFTIDSSIHYDPGDVAVIYPENPKEDVEDFLSLLNVPLDTKFTLIPNDPETPLPKSNLSTVGQYATSYFDIMSVPRRSFFEFFHHFSKDELEKEKLVEFTTAEGQEELWDYCNRPRRTILEVLKDFPHTTPYVPFNYYFDMIPPIRPRSFSIASSLSNHPSQFHLLVAVVEYKTRLRKMRKGLCSNWITQLHLGDTIPFSIKHGSIKLLPATMPIIMIGPGTGCAPFRAFVEERSFRGIFDNYLFFGCRFKDKDFLFSESWYELCKKGALILFTAFSRDQEDKVYVQQRIREKGDLMWDLLHNKGACVYVAGNAKQMPQGVREAFLDVIEKHSGLDHCGSLKYLQVLENQKRYQSETWA